MCKITVETCHIEGLKVITPTVFGDERGYFMETYNYNDYKAAGIDMEFVQDNQSSSRKGVLRGLHFQINYPQDGLESYFLLKTRNSSSFRKTLHTDLLCFLIPQSLHTNAQIFIIRTMRAVLRTMTRTSVWNGRFRKAWN